MVYDTLTHMLHTKYLISYLNPWHMGTHLRVYSARALLWIPTWQGLDVFQKSLCPCALDESSLSMGRVPQNDKCMWKGIIPSLECSGIWLVCKPLLLSLKEMFLAASFHEASSVMRLSSKITIPNALPLSVLSLKWQEKALSLQQNAKV